jgi:hypothetical protein
MVIGDVEGEIPTQITSEMRCREQSLGIMRLRLREKGPRSRKPNRKFGTRRADGLWSVETKNKEQSRRVVESSTAMTLLRFFGSVQLIHSSRFTIFIACEVAAHILPMATSTRLLMILLMILSRGD